ncbi:MAG: YceI family protein [Phycisphaerae bacterium]|jgi:polyisoprenoid-binding protein YceI|nr:YceI family protein [Phycisphaerae bacterium]MBT6282427.1 YceI family protein [Phycisphaerae bacterium]
MFLLKLIALPLFFGLSMLTTAQEVEPVNESAFQIDSVHSTAIFKAHHLGAGMFYGRFNDVTGTIQVDNGMPVFAVSIAIDSVDTNSTRLDGHLKSPDFFNAVEFPTMMFKSNSSTLIGGKTYEVIGEITMHGITKPLTVQMVKTGQVKNRRGEMIGYETEFNLARSDFGMLYGIEGGSLSDEIKVIVALEAVRK